MRLGDSISANVFPPYLSLRGVRLQTVIPDGLRPGRDPIVATTELYARVPSGHAGCAGQFHSTPTFYSLV